MIALRLASFLFLALIIMAARPSSAAATVWRTFLKPFRDCIERPKSANASARPSNPTQVSVSSASGAHDPVPGNDAGSAERTALSKYIGSISVLSGSTSPGGNVTLNQGMYCPGFLPHRSSGLSPPSRSHHPLPGLH